MLAPERDQTATLEALREFRVFLATYPDSKYRQEVLRLERETRDRLSESEFLVGRQYYRMRWYVGAVQRLEALLKEDPQYTGRDGAYFYLGEAFRRQEKLPEARAYYQRVIDEFRVSEYREDATKRLAELGPSAVAGSKPAPAAAPPAPASTPQPAPPASAPQTPATTPQTPATASPQVPR
jgi:outer membrane protein assembly factor BamD